jgi:type II secretory pathway pseudopilin PulG
MVIALVGVLAVVALPRLLDLTAWRLGAFADTLRAEMLGMQRLALAQRRPVIATITGNGVAFAYVSGGALGAVDCPATTGACIAEGGTRSVTLNAGNGGAAQTSTGAALPLTISAGSTTLNWVIENDSGLMRRGP